MVPGRTRGGDSSQRASPAARCWPVGSRPGPTPPLTPRPVLALLPHTRSVTVAWPRPVPPAGQTARHWPGLQAPALGPCRQLRPPWLVPGRGPSGAPTTTFARAAPAETGSGATGKLASLYRSSCRYLVLLSISGAGCEPARLHHLYCLVPSGSVGRGGAPKLGPVVQPGVHAGLSSRRPRVQIPSGPRSDSSVGRARA